MAWLNTVPAASIESVVEVRVYQYYSNGTRRYQRHVITTKLWQGMDEATATAKRAAVAAESNLTQTVTATMNKQNTGGAYSVTGVYDVTDPWTTPA